MIGHAGQDRFAAALLDPRRTIASELTTWNGSDPEARLDVYRNNVIVSLIEALATTFPVTRAMLGHEAFRDACRDYVRTSPPVSPRLAAYGKTFPAFLGETGATDVLPGLADVARLEWLRVHAYHARDADPVGEQEFAALLSDPDRLAQVRFGLHPACHWLRSPHPVVTLWAAHQDDDSPDAEVAGGPEDALIVRPRFDVGVMRLPPGGVDFLMRLAQGASLQAATERALAAHAGFDLTWHLTLLIQHGLVVRLSTQDC